MTDLRRITVAVAALALAAALAVALPASARQAGRAIGHAPAAHNGTRPAAVVYHLRPSRVGPPLGACTAADGDSSTAFALGPGQMNTSSGLDVTLSTANLPSGVVGAGFDTALNNAISQWEATDLGTTAFNTPSTTASVVSAKRDGISTVSFSGRRVGSAVGLTLLQSFDSSGNLTEADTILNSKYPWSLNGTFSGNPDSSGATAGCGGEAGKFDVQAVLTHELGHWVRLDHVLNDVQTMYPVIGTGELRKRTLAAGDTAGANAKY